MYTPKHLKRWTSEDPATGETSNYIGERPDDCYVGPVSVNPGSNCLSRANWEVIATELKSLGAEIHRFGHWACGWYEILLIPPDADDALERADYWAARLQDYPVADETVWSDMEFEEAYQWWKDMGLRGRVELCEEAGINIFAARHVDQIPDNTYVWDRLTAV